MYTRAIHQTSNFSYEIRKSCNYKSIPPNTPLSVTANYLHTYIIEIDINLFNAYTLIYKLI